MAARLIGTLIRHKYNSYMSVIICVDIGFQNNNGIIFSVTTKRIEINRKCGVMPHRSDTVFRTHFSVNPLATPHQIMPALIVN
jgi:hypothetical protein